MDSAELAAIRQTYRSAGLLESDLEPDPIAQFAGWLATAVAAALPEPNAMIVATADEHGRPSARTVLLKAYDPNGFVFYTNYGSRKAHELAVNPRASLVFPWHAIGRQVIVYGPVTKLSAELSAAYFRTRPHDSRIGAWVSRQSAVIGSRNELEDRFAELGARWPPGTEVPVPDFWGGFRVQPEAMEFWQGRERRLHDRLLYRRTGGGGDEIGGPRGKWTVERLAP